MNQAYLDTVRLLLRVAPHVFASGRFGLKGGTALNLFVHDMPRLSVDIDVVFLDHALPRSEALAAIGIELARVKTSLKTMDVAVHLPASHEGEDVKLIVSSASAQVKVEVNQVFRGSVMPCERRSLVDAAEDLFTTSITLPVLAEPELYGSKLVAAFDRQHPRDWFDVLHMRRRGGLTADVVACFVAYLAGHNRPIHEVLFPNVKAMGSIYDEEFRGMTIEDVPLADLESARAETLVDVPLMLSVEQRQFLLSLAQAEPRWELMPFGRLSELPAVRWKLQNLQKLRSRNKRKFADQHDLLEARLASV
jgi:hypothetical protein